MTSTDASQKPAGETPPQNSAQASEGHQDKTDTLLECLVFLTSHYGRAKSAEAIRAGLAYDEAGMNPALFSEAADRLQLKTGVKKKANITAIPAAVFPVVLLLQKNQACVLLSRDGDKARVYVPEAGQEKQVDLARLQKVYTGQAIYIQPRPEFADPENPHKKDMDRHWFWGIVSENKSIYSKVLLAAIFINLFGLTSPLFIMTVYDRVIPNNAIATGWVLGIGALTVYVFDLIMRTLRGYFIDFAGRKIDIMASRRIYDQLLDMKLAGRPASGGAFANMLRDFDSVRDFMTSATVTALVDLPFSLLFIFVIYLVGGPIGLMLFFLILVVMGVGLLLQWPLKVMVAKSVHSSEAKHGLLVETIGGLETIKAIGGEGRMRARYGSHVGESAAHAQKSRFISALGVNIATFLQQSATIIVVLMGMYLVRDAELTMGALIACVILGGRAISPIGQIANLVARYHQARSSLKTLNDVMAKPVERPGDKQFLHRPALSGKLTFEKVDFTYPHTERQVLDNISFTIAPGENVGLIGRVGSGKSTVARLIMGLYDPDSGALYADDTDYRQIDPADLRRNIAYISQDIVLFRGSIRENIAISRPQATEDEILAAAKLSGVHDFISRHPMGYDAPVGERGDGLSGGQKQAVALARAMLLQPSMMVCDEPTNAMDTQAEEAFTRHIREQIKDKTFIMITHRQHLLRLVDRLILLDQGRLVLDGPRDKVIEALSKGKVEVPAGPEDKPS